MAKSQADYCPKITIIFPKRASKGATRGQRFYLTVREKFFISAFATGLWLAFSYWLAQPWLEELSALVTPYLTYPIILCIALTTGLLNVGKITLIIPRKAPASVKYAPRFYLSVKTKFIISTFTAGLWFAFSYWVAQPWLKELSALVTPYLAYPIIFCIALIPGFLNIHILMSVFLDNPPSLPLDRLSEEKLFPPITILIAAYNEEKNLPDTFKSINAQNYEAPVEIVVVDDGSTDGTLAFLESSDMPNLKIVQSNHAGKAAALTAGLKSVSNEITVCIDADTYLHPQALKRIVGRLISGNSDMAAVAGAVLVRNSRNNLMTRLQEWDYFIGIASAKRQQSLYQGTLVAQGAFSAFRTSILRRCNGWPSVIGEDIVLTWNLLSKGYRVGYEATAMAFTTAPSRLRDFLRQRQRWARGMIEGLKRYGRLVGQGSLSSFFVGVDFAIPAIDLFYSLVFLPGIILALTGRFYIVGPFTLLVIPLTFLIFLLVYQKQKGVFDELNLKVRKNVFGFFLFLIAYQAIMSPICVAGYVKELAGVKKRW